MKWTSTKPITSAYYWYRNSYDDGIALIFWVNLSLNKAYGDDTILKLNELHGQWSSCPIPLPEE